MSDFQLRRQERRYGTGGIVCRFCKCTFTLLKGLSLDNAELGMDPTDDRERLTLEIHALSHKSTFEECYLGMHLA